MTAKWHIYMTKWVVFWILMLFCGCLFLTAEHCSSQVPS